MPRPESLVRLLGEIRACRVCVDSPLGAALPHQPRPVLRAARSARVAIFGQAPGVRVHASGVPFTDPSGDRLRDWMGVTSAEFYDVERVAIVPMGFCFPGLDRHGGDLPPRRECAPLWRERVLAALPNVELVLLVGSYAQRWHLPSSRALAMTEIVRGWRDVARDATGKRLMPLPHPSWRNNTWIKQNPWFAEELLPELRREVRRLLDQATASEPESGRAFKRKGPALP